MVVYILVTEEDHPHAWDSSRTRILQWVRLKYEIHIICETNALSVRQSQKMVVVQHTIERLNPLRINVSVTDNPWSSGQRLLDNWSSSSSQHSVEPFASVMIHVSEQLCARHGLRVHEVFNERRVQFLISAFQDSQDGGLAAPTGTYYDNSHALASRFVELQHFIDLTLDF